MPEDFVQHGRRRGQSRSTYSTYRCVIFTITVNHECDVLHDKNSNNHNSHHTKSKTES